MGNQKLYTDEILEEFKRVYGQKKYNKIKSDIEKSKKSKQLIHECLTKSLYPPGDEVVACVMSNFKYSFAKGDTLAAASLFLFKDWIDICTRDQVYPFHQIRQIEIDILKRIHKMSFDSSLSILNDSAIFDKREKSKKKNARTSSWKESEENNLDVPKTRPNFSKNIKSPKEHYTKKNTLTDSFNSPDLFDDEIKNCISNSAFHHKSVTTGDDVIIEFLPNGKWQSKIIKKDGSIRLFTSGKWTIVDENIIKREFDPNPSGVTESYNQIISCNRIQVGKTPYFKKQ